MSSDRLAAQQFWDREVTQPSHTSWMSDPTVREYINASIGGASSPSWPIDWFESWLGGRRFARALSIGCGTGALERDLINRGLCHSIDAFDGSVGSLRLAREEAQRLGLTTRIHYYAADFNEPALPRSRYDAVFFHQSAHHVAKLEKLFRAVLHALKPDGILYLDEYVGPSRHEWAPPLLEEHERVYGQLPSACRLSDHVPLPIQADDPSEAFRSSEIMEQLKIGADVATARPYGGNLLSVLYPLLRPEGITPQLVAALIDEERHVLDQGAPSYYAIIAARPKRGIRKLVASTTYYVVPKLKRIVREVRQRVVSGT